MTGRDLRHMCDAAVAAGVDVHRAARAVSRIAEMLKDESARAGYQVAGGIDNELGGVCATRPKGKVAYSCT
jgi:hypothetical protein